jgi:DNA-binding NarL/FixJ family response regulator
MKTFQYTFKYKPAIYDYIMSNLILNEEKKEKEILALLVKGKTCQQISRETNYCERTIQQRRRDIYEKTKDLMV